MNRFALALVVLPLVFHARASANPPTPQVSWVEVVDLDYHDPSVRDCSGAFKDLQSYLDCLAGAPLDPRLRRTPEQVQMTERRQFSYSKHIPISTLTKGLPGWTPGSGPEPFPHQPPEAFPYPWPSHSGIPGSDLPDLPVDHNPNIPARPRPKTYIANSDALNGSGQFVDTAEGSIEAQGMRAMLQTVTCHSDLSRSSATVETVEFKAGRVVTVGSPSAVAGMACLSILDVSGVKTPEAAMQAVRSLLTAHTPSLGRGPSDHFDDLLPNELRGGPFVAIAATCRVNDRIRLVLLPAVAQEQFGLETEVFLTPAGSKYADNPTFGGLPANANRLRAIKLSTNCESDRAVVESAVTSIRELGGALQ